MSAKRAAKVSHTSMAGNVLLCDHCGARQELALPIEVGLFVAITKAWNQSHGRCRKQEGVSAFRYAKNLADWPTSDDTGMSSKAIYRHMHHGPAFAEDFQERRVPFPLDPSDFGRCYRLLALAPDWRGRIAEMAQHNSEWAGLAGAWDELTALYEEEVGPRHRGTAPRLYARMKELLAVSLRSPRGGTPSER